MKIKRSSSAVVAMGMWLTYPLVSTTANMLLNSDAFDTTSWNFAMSGASPCSGMLGISKWSNRRMGGAQRNPSLWATFRPIEALRCLQPSHMLPTNGDFRVRSRGAPVTTWLERRNSNRPTTRILPARSVTRHHASNPGVRTAPATGAAYYRIRNKNRAPSAHRIPAPPRARRFRDTRADAAR